MPDEIMLVVGYPSTVLYRNQVGGVVCYQGELEGILSPVDLSRDTIKRIQKCSYPQGREGITPEIADTIDGLLAAAPGGQFLKVDRTRLDESWEAWVYVSIDSPDSPIPTLFGPYFGSILGFGATHGVLTWLNSD
jgi:hypothetical protein